MWELENLKSHTQLAFIAVMLLLDSIILGSLITYWSFFQFYVAHATDYLKTNFNLVRIRKSENTGKWCPENVFYLSMCIVYPVPPSSENKIHLLLVTALDPEFQRKLPHVTESAILGIAE